VAPIESLIIQQKTIPSDRRLFRVLKGSVTATCTAFKVAQEGLLSMPSQAWLPEIVVIVSEEL
jgi:hypothetical protein